MTRVFSARLGALTAALTVLVPLAITSSGAAVAQTVADYETALMAVPTGAAAAADAAARCVPLSNYTFVSIAPEEKMGPLSLFGAVGALGAELDPAEVATAEQRQTCLQELRRPVITFDGGLGEDIVAQPKLEDPNTPINDPAKTY